MNRSIKFYLQGGTLRIFRIFLFLIEAQEQAVANNFMPMFEGRIDDLVRLLVAVGIPSEDLKNLPLIISSKNPKKSEMDSPGFMNLRFSGSILKAIYQMTEKIEDIEKLLKTYFTAGVTPDFAENPKEADALKG